MSWTPAVSSQLEGPQVRQVAICYPSLTSTHLCQVCHKCHTWKNMLLLAALSRMPQNGSQVALWFVHSWAGFHSGFDYLPLYPVYPTYGVYPEFPPWMKQQHEFLANWEHLGFPHAPSEAAWTPLEAHRTLPWTGTLLKRSWLLMYSWNQLMHSNVSGRDTPHANDPSYHTIYNGFQGSSVEDFSWNPCWDTSLCPLVRTICLNLCLDLLAKILYAWNGRRVFSWHLRMRCMWQQGHCLLAAHLRPSIHSRQSRLHLHHHLAVTDLQTHPRYIHQLRMQTHHVESHLDLQLASLGIHKSCPWRPFDPSSHWKTKYQACEQIVWPSPCSKLHLTMIHSRQWHVSYPLCSNETLWGLCTIEFLPTAPSWLEVQTKQRHNGLGKNRWIHLVSEGNGKVLSPRCHTFSPNWLFPTGRQGAGPVVALLSCHLSSSTGDCSAEVSEKQFHLCSRWGE